jgi:hypothetical protein
MARPALAALAVVASTLALGGAASSYAPLPLPAWVVSGGASGGTVETIAVSGTTAYIGGDFGYMGPETGSAVSLDSSSGALTPGWPVVGGDVYAIAADGAGGWFVGGAFASVGTRHADNVAHIKADGTFDTGFAASTDGPVYALARDPVSGTLFAGGLFAAAGGQPRARLAGFDTTSGAATAFNPGVTGNGPLVSALELAGSTLYVGGAFTGLGGAARPNLGAVDTAGQLLPWNPRPNGLVNAIAAAPGGTVYAGGFFDAVNGTIARQYAAAFDADGTATEWHPLPDAEVYAVEVAGSTVYLGGAFSSVTAQPRAALAALDATTGAVQSWRADAAGAVYQLALAGGTLFAGGSFQIVNNSTTGYDNVAAFSAATGAPTAFSPVIGGDVFALGVDGSNVVAGGAFRTAGVADGEPVRRDNLGAVDLTTAAVTGWAPATDDTVFTLGVSGTTVYAGGAFTKANGLTRTGLASFDGASGALTTWDPGVNGVVFALDVLGSNVYSGGNFTSANYGTRPRSRLAAFPASGPGIALPTWLPSANGTVFALDVAANTIYAGGDFTSVSGNARARLASFDQNGTLSTWNPTANNTVYALAHAGGAIYAGGSFTAVNSGLPRAAAAAFDANGAATPWNPRLMAGTNTAGVVYALSPTLSTMYAGGIFNTVGDCASGCSTVPGLAALSLRDAGALTSWQPAANGIVNAVAVSGFGVVAGGSFTALGYPPRGVPYGTVEPDATYRGGLAFLRGLPDAPAFVSVVPGDREITLTLQQPFLLGGTFVSYTVTASPDGGTQTGAGGEFTFGGLTNGTPYTFSVTATTTVGTGPPAVSAPVAPRTVPDAPTGVTGTGGDTTATISFTPPAFDGGAPVTSYVVRATPGQRSATGSASPITVTGLRNDTDYTFTVSAVNPAGEGAPSAPSGPVTPHEGGRKHHSAPDPTPRPDVPPPPVITTPRPPVPHDGA